LDNDNEALEGFNKKKADCVALLRELSYQLSMIKNFFFFFFYIFFKDVIVNGKKTKKIKVYDIYGPFSDRKRCRFGRPG
jgi:hypothetical protein